MIIPRFPKTYAIGESVTHLVHGLGVIQSEWGSWFSCRKCNEPLYFPKVVRQKGRPKVGVVKRTSGRSIPPEIKCRNCGKTDLPFLVNGRGVFSVQFTGGMTHCIHADWLAKAKLEVVK